MKVIETLHAASRKEWRRWLAKHHKDEKEVWLVLHKKSSTKTAISYDDAVEEAVCYGWIDVQTKRIDEERYAIRFTPRREKSRWSKSNRARALKMLLQGKMTEAGKALLPTGLLKRERYSTGTW